MARQERPAREHDHQKIAVRTYCVDCGQELAQRVFDRADVEKQHLAELPDREAMSLVNANIAAPINVAAALNVLADGSIATADANQDAPIDQGVGAKPPELPAEG